MPVPALAPAPYACPQPRLSPRMGAAGRVYVPGQRCTFCWGRAWHIGRVTAECDGCGDALALSASEARP